MKTLLVYGFLGSGKTTLIEKLLSGGWAESAVVLENEAGDHNIDGDILRRSGYNVVDLRSGCICCTLRASLQQSVEEIRECYSPDILVVEPSGIASLSDLMDIRGISLDGIVALADVTRWRILMQVNPAFYLRQFSMAPFIVLTKTDLCPPEDIEAVREALRRINGKAFILDSYDDFIAVGCDFFFESCSGFANPVWLPDNGRPEFETATYHFSTDCLDALKAWLSEHSGSFLRTKYAVGDNGLVLFVCWKDSPERIMLEPELICF